ncbi:MAG: hypothetical protein M3O34_14240 [Chloroflexota bacterium]|nr:hypothetical protein [Chloroflexota bacterium]
MSVHVSLIAVSDPVKDRRVQARIAGLPAVTTAGAAFAEAKDLLLDVLRECLPSLGA